MKKLRYLVRINKDPDSDWGATVPDLPGCVAAGKSIVTTLRRIEKIITIHLRGMHEDGIKKPPHDTVQLLPDIHLCKWIFMQPLR